MTMRPDGLLISAVDDIVAPPAEDSGAQGGSGGSGSGGGGSGGGASGSGGPGGASGGGAGGGLHSSGGADLPAPAAPSPEFVLACAGVVGTVTALLPALDETIAKGLPSAQRR